MGARVDAILFDGVAQRTVTFEVGDTLVTLGDTATILYQAGQTKDKKVSSILFTVEGDPVRIAFGDTTPTQGALGVGHLLFDRAALTVNQFTSVKTLKFLTSLSGGSSRVQVTPMF